VLLVFIGALVVKGVIRGFFREAFGLAALVAGAGLSVWAGERFAAEVVSDWVSQPVWGRAIAHGVLFLGPYLGLQASGFLLHKLGRAILLGGADRVVGGLFGAVTGVVAAGAGLAAAQRAGIGGPWLAESAVARQLSEGFLWLLDLTRDWTP
jgi:membrane protein required for colicin V production